MPRAAPTKEDALGKHAESPKARQPDRQADRSIDRFGPGAKNEHNERNKRMTEHDLQKQAELFKALGHPSRLRMVIALGEGEKCVCELRELVGSDVSTVSKHLAIMRAAGLVESFKRGNFVYYRLLRGCVTTFIRCLEEAEKPEAQKPAKQPTDACGCSCGRGKEK